MIFDVFIVGAGSSRSYLAYLLARQGSSVAVIDKEEFPRDKPYGGGLSRKTLWLPGFDLGRVTQVVVRGALLTYENRETVAREIDDCAGVTTLGSEFDDFLRSNAQAAGAAFFPKTAFLSAERKDRAIRVNTRRQAFVARYLIGADGVGSQARKSIVGLVLGTVGYKECLYPLAASVPYWLFSKRYGYSPGLQL